MYGFNNPQYRIIHARGREGVNALPMAPNSDALILDDTAPIVWCVQVDGVGYKTVTPYQITPYEPAPEITNADLLERIERLESELHEYESHSTAATKSYDKPSGKQQPAVSTSDKVRQ